MLFYRDIIFSYAPMKRAVALSLAAGEWPAWWPNILMGVPLLTEVSAAPLYPANLLLLLPFDFGSLLSLLIILHYPLALLAFYALLRGENLNRIPALVGATAFAWSGMILSESSFCHQLTVSVWGPLLLWAIGREGRSPALGSVVWALAVSGGAYERLLLLGPLAVAYAFLRNGSDGVRQSLLSLLIGTAIAGPCWFPVLTQVLGASTRSGGLAWVQATRESIGPARWMSLILPVSFIDAQWNSPDLDIFAGGLALHGSLYLGVSTLILAALSARSARRGALRFWAGALLVGLLLAGGSHSVFFRMAWEVLPPIRLFRFPVKYLWLASFALAVLSAYGTEVLASRAMSLRNTLLAASCATLLAIGGGAFLADRLHDRGQSGLADLIDEAQLGKGIKLSQVSHLMFTFSGNDPAPFLRNDLGAYKGKVLQHSVGLRVHKHQAFIKAVYKKVIADGGKH